MADVAPIKFYGRSKRNAVVPIDTRRPDWLRVRLPGGSNYSELKEIMRGLDLHTVCEEARCPNIGECWQARTATFMILGDTCTRACGFCAVKTGRPGTLDLGEPIRVAEAVERMGLHHAVITSVNRDELEDGGSAIFAGTIRQIRKRIPKCNIEVLIPDFMGDESALSTVMRARPDILNHNIETVPSLYPQVRPKGRYPRSLELLQRAKRMDATVYTKSGIMLGLGEEIDEVIQVFRDLRAHDVEILTVGQYLRPTPNHLPIARYVTPDEFAMLKVEALKLGFRHVESGPLVRSSYHAASQVPDRAAAG
jgi:lipoic acid synthetase